MIPGVLLSFYFLLGNQPIKIGCSAQGGSLWTWKGGAKESKVLWEGDDTFPVGPAQRRRQRGLPLLPAPTSKSLRLCCLGDLLVLQQRDITE